MDNLLKDFRFALRVLSKAPGFTAVAVLTLALGIGANSTIFSWINSTLLSPIPGITQTSSLFSVSRGRTEDNPVPFSYLDYIDLRDRNRSFVGLTASSAQGMALTGSGKPQLVWGALASANYFDVLGVKPITGRGFLPAEGQKPGGSPVVVISHRLWQTNFGGDPSVIGRTININQHPYTLIGVTPPGFQGSQTGLRMDLWIPLMMEQQIIPGGDLLQHRGAEWLFLLGRLKPGIPPQQATQEMNLLGEQIAQQDPDSHKGSKAITIDPLWRAPYGANGYLYILLPTLLAIAGVLLLLACVNVANLLLVRAVARRREMAIRLAIGAGRWQLVRQLLVESLLLSGAGGTLAMLITTWTAGTFTDFIPPTNIPIALSVHADRTVLLATVLVSLVTGAIFGIVPALRSSGLSPATVLKEEIGSASGGLHRARLSSGLAVAQVALSLLLLISAGLFIRAFWNAQRFDPGFNPDHVLTASYDLFSAGYTRAKGREFNRQLLAKLEALPEVQSVSLADWMPLGFTLSFISVTPEIYVPQPHESMTIGDADIGPNYFRTLKIPLVAGRDFTLQDTEESQQVAIVNQAFASRYWPQQDALGKRLKANEKWYSVIGVARDSDYYELNEAPVPFVYFSLFQGYSPRAIVHARVLGDPLVFARTLEKAIHELNADLPVFDVAMLESQVQIASTSERIAGTFVGAFGLLALILAAVGIYGVIAYTTRQRTREIGVRVAVGAQQRDIFQLVLGQGLRLTLLGLAIGLALSFALTRFLRSMLFGVTATDAVTFLFVAALLCLVSLAACIIPARRAMRVDPISALRYE
jgi:putative ABC transport system permease protein